MTFNTTLWYYPYVVFIESRAFTRRLHQLAKEMSDSVLTNIQGALLDDPARGDMVKGLGGIRKARVSNPGRGKGKRGGFRYMYLYLERRNHEQEDLNAAQRGFLKQLVDRIKG